MEEDSVVDDAIVYKETRNSDLVVIRKLELYQKRFLTYHDYEKDPADHRTWYLDRNCKLDPPSADQITSSMVKWKRPRGTWTITATYRAIGSKEHEVTLWGFALSWPASWATKGYSSFHFLFDNQGLAVHWHQVVAERIEALRVAEGAKATIPLSKAGSMSRLPSVMRDRQSQEQSGDSLRSQYSAQHDPIHEEGVDSRASPLSLPPAAAAQPTFLRPSASADAAGGTQSQVELGGDSEDECEQAPSVRTSQPVFEHWVPYRQANGVAVYNHTQEDDTTGIGGEYMVSAVVRGTPRQALDALLSTRARGTHILGPARCLEVLVAGPEHDAGAPIDEGREVLRMVIEPPLGLARRVCALRELVVERVVKHDEDEGVYVVLFSSCDPPPSESPPAPRPHPGFFAPVRGKVRGAWSIAPLEGFKLETSPECLVTCIVKADLGGIFSEHSWFKPVADALGWTDAFLDRILMTVTIIRDEVEHRRFTVHPFGLLTSSGPQAGVPMVDLAPPAVTQPQDGAPPDAPLAASFGRMSTRLHNQPRRRLSTVRVGSQGHAEDGGTPEEHSRSGRLQSDEATSTSDAAYADIVDPGAAENGAAAQAGAGDSAGYDDAGGEEAMATLDLEYIKSLSLLRPGIWEPIHTPGKDAPFRVRGATYLTDRKKIPAGQPQFVLASFDVVELEPDQPAQHIARWIPAIRQSGAPFAFIINLIIPGTPLLCIVITFINEHHPDTMGEPPKHPMEEQHTWTPFDLVLHRYMHGDVKTRALMLKLIPHIADGSWLIKSSVGTTPVIIGKALQCHYHETPQYIEVDIDVTANTVANYVTGLVRSATRSLVIDLGFVLEGQTPWELPESLLGCFRLHNLDLRLARKVDTTREIPLRPPVGTRAARNSA